MSDPTAIILLTTAASIGFLHTMIGVDHYLPFVVIGRARKWTLRRTLGITAACGLGHVVGSILLGFIGIGLGVALDQLTWVESVRGSIAAWSLIAFGLVYGAWGWLRAQRNQQHAHAHTHSDGTVHTHPHRHGGEHLHAHEEKSGRTLTTWALFLVFVFGPCEALIPLLMAPAWAHNWLLVAGVTATFALVTIGTMLTLVTVGYLGLRISAFQQLDRYAHALAGFAIAASGLAIQVLGI